jgi:hypothetical protein
MGMVLGWRSIRTLPPAFDPYPFILLNLVLSCLAALQAPVIHDEARIVSREGTAGDAKLDYESTCGPSCRSRRCTRP